MFSWCLGCLPVCIVVYSNVLLLFVHKFLNNTCPVCVEYHETFEMRSWSLRSMLKQIYILSSSATIIAHASTLLTFSCTQCLASEDICKLQSPGTAESFEDPEGEVAEMTALLRLSLPWGAEDCTQVMTDAEQYPIAIPSLVQLNYSRHHHACISLCKLE
jgi:hypothetical protein